jgi:hypothetical protein
MFLPLFFFVTVLPAFFAKVSAVAPPCCCQSECFATTLGT